MSNSPISPAAAAAELLKRRHAKRSLTSFIEYISDSIRPAAHHRLLIEHLEGVERGDIKQLMVWMPPGSAKSTYTSVLFPPWYMGRNPSIPVIGVSNTTELAERFSRRARNITADPLYRNVFGFGCSEDTKSAGYWENEAGGEFFAAGIGSAIAGRRAKLGLIDDPIKSREEADSERTRQKHWDWYLNDFETRLMPNAAQIVIQTRWHEDDLSGRILQRSAGDWVVLKLPMIAQPDDPLKRAVGDRLWPEWFTDDMVERAKHDMRGWNSLYQQDPAPDDGVYFERDMFGTYKVRPKGMHVYAASDYAVTEGGGDYTEHGVFGLDYNGDLHILDWWRGQTASSEWIERQCDFILQWKPLTWFGESGPIRRAIEPFLKRRMEQRRAHCRLEWLPSIADKPTRARAFQGLASMGKVYLPEKAVWLSELFGQLMKFPAGKYDDGVDVCSLIGRGLEMAKAPEMPEEPQSIARSYPREQGWMG